MELHESNFAELHPELHHYTDFVGLEGIVSTGTLWATHYSGLNDPREVTLIKEVLSDATRTHFRRKLALHAKMTFRDAERAAREFIDIFHQTTFGTLQGPNGKIAPFSEPYVACFCSHTTEPYEQENGLLSQ